MIRGTKEQDLIIVNIALHLITQPQKDIKQQLTEMQGEIYKSTVMVDFNTSHEKSGLDEAQARMKIAGRNINNLRYADNTTLMAEGAIGLRKTGQLQLLQHQWLGQKLG